MYFLATLPVNRQLNCKPAPSAKRKTGHASLKTRQGGSLYVWRKHSSKGALLSMLLPADSGQHCREVCFAASSLHNPSTSCSWLPLLMKTILKRERLFRILPTQCAEPEGKAGKVRTFVEKVCWLNHALWLLSESERCFAADAEGRVRLARIPKRRPGSPFVHSSMLTLRRGLGISSSFYIPIHSPTCCQLAGK